jgi:hypothetical protein
LGLARRGGLVPSRLELAPGDAAVLLRACALARGLGNVDAAIDLGNAQ